MPVIGFVLYPQVLSSTITLPAEMFTAADHFQRARQRSKSGLEIRIARSKADDYQTSILPANCSLPDLASVDLLYLPALWRNPLPVVVSHVEISPLLQRLSGGGSLICAVGTGSCFLAEAGLLDHKPATTHWFFLDQFARRYPAVHTKNRHLITRADNLFCAASINSMADLTSHFIERFYGPGIARQVDSHFSPEIRRSYLEHGFFEGETNRHHDELIIDAQQWLREHFSESVSLGGLADRLGISQRSLNRRFQRASGQTPVGYLQQLRIQHACDLLRDTNLSIANIAAEVGYSDFTYFSTLFRERMTQTPSEYRKSVRGKLFGTSS